MDLYERNTCSFIVKVWVEGSDDQNGQGFWRGHITHVFSGKRQYFEDLNTVVKYVKRYLEEMDISPKVLMADGAWKDKQSSMRFFI